MKLTDGSRTRKKWEKPLGVFLIVFGYLFLAAGIVLACLSVFPTQWRIVSAIGGFIVYVILGAVGYLLTDISLSDYRLQRKREWAGISSGDRFLYVITYPCRLIMLVLKFFNM